jgi:toxin CcdB
MARFDVPTGLFVDLQNDLIYHLTTRMVAPLIPVVGGPLQATRLNPIVDIEGTRYALHPQLMAAVPMRILPRPIGSLHRYYDEIVAAIDMVFLGF